LLKSFGSDFGSEINHYFTVADGYEAASPDGEVPIVNLFPIRNSGKFSVEMFFNDIQKNVVVRIDSENTTNNVFEKTYNGVKEAIVPIDIAKEPDGFYILKLTSDDKTVTKKFKVKHKG